LKVLANLELRGLPIGETQYSKQLASTSPSWASSVCAPSDCECLCGLLSCLVDKLCCVHSRSREADSPRCRTEFGCKRARGEEMSSAVSCGTITSLLPSSCLCFRSLKHAHLFFFCFSVSFLSLFLFHCLCLSPLSYSTRFGQATSLWSKWDTWLSEKASGGRECC